MAAEAPDFSRRNFIIGTAAVASIGGISVPGPALAAGPLAALGVVAVRAVVRGIGMWFLGRSKLAAHAESLKTKSDALAVLLNSGVASGLLPGSAAKVAAVIKEIATDGAQLASRTDSSLMQYLASDLSSTIRNLNLGTASLATIERADPLIVGSTLYQLHPLVYGAVHPIEIGGVLLKGRDPDLQTDSPLKETSLAMVVVRDDVLAGLASVEGNVRKMLLSEPDMLTGTLVSPVATSAIVAKITSALAGGSATISASLRGLRDLAFEVSPLIPTATHLEQKAEDAMAKLVQSAARVTVSTVGGSDVQKIIGAAKDVAQGAQVDYTLLDYGIPKSLASFSVSLRPVELRPLQSPRVMSNVAKPTQVSIRVMRRDALDEATRMWHASAKEV